MDNCVIFLIIQVRTLIFLTIYYKVKKIWTFCRKCHFVLPKRKKFYIPLLLLGLLITQNVIMSNNSSDSFSNETIISQFEFTYVAPESSMIDQSLMATLFRAINWQTVQRIILVGDPNQLPPIGYAKVFADLIQWLPEENKGELKENLRQRENKLEGRGTGILELTSVFIQLNHRFARFATNLISYTAS